MSVFFPPFLTNMRCMASFQFHSHTTKSFNRKERTHLLQQCIASKMVEVSNLIVPNYAYETDSLVAMAQKVHILEICSRMEVVNGFISTAVAAVDMLINSAYSILRLVVVRTHRRIIDALSVPFAANKISSRSLWHLVRRSCWSFAEPAKEK